MSLRDQDRDPDNRDIDTEAQGLAAEAAARQNTGRGGGAGGRQAPPDVRIDWSGMPRRARQVTVPGNAIGKLSPAPEGHSVALTCRTPSPAAAAAAANDPSAGIYIVNVESAS